MRLAHISDLHFGSFSLSPFQFFSKRWIGNFNYLLTRKRQFAYNRLIDLIALLKQQQVTHVVITGDITVTARQIEYEMGSRFVKLLQKAGMAIFVVPGNHDHYTKRSYKKGHFYRLFPTTFDPTCPLNLKDDRVTYIKLQDKLWLIGLDTALATSPFSARGLFSSTIEENLHKALQAIPSNARVILANHYPFFHNKSGKHELLRGEELESLLKKYPQIALYLHGHTHQRIVADLRASDLPIISDSGSTPHIQSGACHLFEIGDNGIELEVYLHDSEWKASETHKFCTHRDSRRIGL